MDMAQAYDAFGNGGFKAHGYGIERIRTATGKVLYDHGAALSPRATVIAEPALGEMDQMLRGVITSGTGARARIGAYDLAGKTGTTSDYKDAWFIGFTGGFVAAVWVGKDDNTPMKKVTGGGAPAEIWRNFMVAALPRLAIQPIPGGPAPLPIAIDAADTTGSDEAQAPDSESPRPESPPGRSEPVPF